MPDLAPALVQFPVVALVFLAAWAVVKWTDRRHAADLARERERSASEVATIREAAAQVREADARRITALEREATGLRRRNTKLQNQLDAERARRGGKP